VLEKWAHSSAEFSFDHAANHLAVNTKLSTTTDQTLRWRSRSFVGMVPEKNFDSLFNEPFFSFSKV
jgi:hypothetical protein